jgi:Na+/proline symporter
MLIWFVVIYLLASIAIGLYAATRVHNAKDFAVAGRSLPMPVVTATVFATWFGAEAVFGVSATFVKDGLSGVVADPFGASMCLIIAGIFYGTKLYKLNILTLGDFFRMRYNRPVEILTTLCIVVSYLGWVSAQIKALGLVFSVVTNGAISPSAGMILGAAIVLTYTTFGGMLSVAILDFVQMGVVMGGMLYIGYLISGMTGGVEVVVNHASAAGKLEFFPTGGAVQWLTFLGAWITMMLGSIPQQDVFPACHLGAQRTYRHHRLHPRRGALLLFYLCADVHCLFGNPDRPREVQQPDPDRFATGFADAGPPAHTGFRSSHFLRCGARSDHELFVSNPAGTFGGFLRKYPACILPSG